MTRQVLFVCTGNVFRSLTAEYALRAALGARSEIAVASAGTEDYGHVVPPEISEHLRSKGLDVRPHRRRTLTREIVDASQLVIAMSLDHREFIRERFGRTVPDFKTNRAAAVAYLQATMDHIIELTPRLAARLGQLIPSPPSR